MENGGTEEVAQPSPAASLEPKPYNPFEEEEEEDEEEEAPAAPSLATSPALGHLESTPKSLHPWYGITPTSSPKTKKRPAPALPAHPHWLSTPPASRTRSRLQPHHRQRSVWRACHPRAPARLQVGSFWSHQLCPRAPQSLLSMPLAPLETLSASLPTPLWHPLGS